MSGDFSEQSGERCVGHNLEDTAHGVDNLLFEQDVLRLEHKEACELGDDDVFHLHVCGMTRGRQRHTRGLHPRMRGCSAASVVGPLPQGILCTVSFVCHR